MGGEWRGEGMGPLFLKVHKRNREGGRKERRWCHFTGLYTQLCSLV